MPPVRLLHPAIISLTAALAAVPAHAAVTQILSPGGLTGTTAMLGYSGVPNSEITSPVLLTGVGNTLTLTTAGGGLYFQTSDGVGFDYDAGTPLLETNTAGSSALPDGPLTLSFASPVTEFGLFAEDAEPDNETFSFIVDGTQSGAQTFTLPQTDNISTTSGTAVFLGADAGTGNGFTQVTISSASDVPGGSNDFFVGPVAIPAAVPEASPAALLGVGVLAVFSTALLARRRHSQAH